MSTRGRKARPATATLPGPALLDPRYADLDMTKLTLPELESLGLGVPPPCRACARSDRPERFHSHPGPKQRPARSPARSPVPTPRPATRLDKLRAHNPPSSPRPTREREKKLKNEIKEKSTKSDIYCVYCGKNVEDDEAAIKNHEKECLDKWKRRKINAADMPVITDAFKTEFDGVSEMFWQQHLTQLVACSKCSRKFNPDRVEIHEKSCKGQ